MFLGIDLEYLPQLLIAFVRISILLMLVPLFGDKILPDTMKILMISVISILVVFNLPMEKIIYSSESQFVFQIMFQAFIGLMLGFVSRVIFDGIQFGGNVLGHFMGFASINIYDVHQESNTDLVAKYMHTFTMMIFFVSNGHILVLEACMKSFELLPIGVGHFKGLLFKDLISLTQKTILIGLQIAAPVGGCIFLVNCLFGFVGRMIPQLNVYILAPGITALVGFSLQYLMQSELLEFLVDHTNQVATDIMFVVKLIQKGS
jgi:flagellar biosynthetic protein FliR